MSDELFPSGPWVGFYNHLPGDRHRMDMNLTFANGSMAGAGNDDVGRFLIKGRYEAATRECHWTKSYVGAHDVFYRGFREGKGIWGTWEIAICYHGGFHIWPRGADEGEAHSETTEQLQPVDAISPSVNAPVEPASTKSQTIRLRREAFGVRRIPALSLRAVWNSHTAPEYGALQTLRAVRLRLSRCESRCTLSPVVIDPSGTINRYPSATIRTTNPVLYFLGSDA